MLYYHNPNVGAGLHQQPVLTMREARDTHKGGRLQPMAKVYIVNAGGHNHHKARTYGELVPITRGYVSQGSLDRVFFDVINGIKDSSAGDWLLPSGLMFLNIIAATAWIARHSQLSLLVWDKKERLYRPFETDITHINEIWDQGHEWHSEGPGPEVSDR